MDDLIERCDEEQESSSVYTAETVGNCEAITPCINANITVSAQYLEYQG